MTSWRGTLFSILLLPCLQKYSCLMNISPTALCTLFAERYCLLSWTHKRSFEVTNTWQRLDIYFYIVCKIRKLPPSTVAYIFQIRQDQPRNMFRYLIVFSQLNCCTYGIQWDDRNVWGVINIKVPVNPAFYFSVRGNNCSLDNMQLMARQSVSQSVGRSVSQSNRCCSWYDWRAMALLGIWCSEEVGFMGGICALMT
jgi:hypothetical protein